MAVYLALRMTLVPALHFDFYADDFFLLDWASHLSWGGWLDGFFEPGHFNLTYRPMALLIYLIYLFENRMAGYLVLDAIFLANAALIFVLCRNLGGRAFATLTGFFFIGSFIYYDATHRIYNLLTQCGALFFLMSLVLWQSSVGPGGDRSVWRRLSWFFYALSLATYEITFFGFAIVFALALDGDLSARQTMKDAVGDALRQAWPYVAIAFAYAALNVLSPLKAEHLSQHAIPLALSSIPLVAQRLVGNIENSLSWILTVERGPAFRDMVSLESVALSICLAAVLGFVIVESAAGASRELRRWAALGALGMYWFIVVLAPSAFASYFDYRLTFLAYVGFSMALSAALIGCYQTVVQALGSAHRAVAQGCVASMLAVLGAVWILSNVALSERMDRNLIAAGTAQRRLVESFQPYVDDIATNAVVAVGYKHVPAPSLPYVYQASPFPEDFGLKYALHYYYGKEVEAANLFFETRAERIAVGRFVESRVLYPYDRLALFDFDGTNLVRRASVEVGRERIPLPLAHGAAKTSS